MQTQTKMLNETAAPAPVVAKRGRGRPKSDGPTVETLRAEVKSLGGWVRGMKCASMKKDALIAYVAELKQRKASH